MKSVMGEERAEAFGADAFGEAFDAAGHAFQLGHERAKVGLLIGGESETGEGVGALVRPPSMAT